MSGRLSSRSSCSSRSSFIYPGGSGSGIASPKFLSFERDSEFEEFTSNDQINDRTLIAGSDSDDASETTLSSSGDERYLQTRLSDLEVQSTNRSEDFFSTVNGSELRILPRLTDSQIRRAILETTDSDEMLANTTGSGNLGREEARRLTSEEHSSSPRAIETGSLDEAPLVPEEDLTEDQIRLRKALAKMRKLDKILIKKQKLADRVKRDRISLQRHVVSEVEMLEAANESDRTPSREEAVNTHKYLAMVRNDIKIKPDESANSSQLRVEGANRAAELGSDGNYEPLFATQPPIDDDLSGTTENVKTSPKKGSLKKPNKKTSLQGKPKGKGNESAFTANDGTADSDRSASTIGGSSKSVKSGMSSTSKQSHKSTSKHFIERNKELAADAASMIPMTPEERSRLDCLLENVDFMDENQDITEDEDFRYEDASSSRSFVGSAPFVGKGGKNLGGGKQKRRYHAISAQEEKLLTEIDDRLSGYLTFEQFKQICWQDAPESDTLSSTSMSALEKGDDKIRETREDRISQIRLAHIDEKLRRLKIAGQPQKEENRSDDGDRSLPAITDFQMRQLLNEIGTQHANDTAQGIMYPKPNKEELRTLLSREANLADEFRDWNYIEYDRSKTFSQELKELTKFADDIETFLAIEYNTEDLSDDANPSARSSHIAKPDATLSSSAGSIVKNYTVVDLSREMEYLDKRADMLMQRLHNLPEIPDANVEKVSSEEIVRSVTFEDIEQNERLYELDRDMENLRKKLASLEQLRKETLSNISVDTLTNDT